MDSVNCFLADLFVCNENCRHQECIHRLDIFVRILRQPTGQIEGILLVKSVLFGGSVEVNQADRFDFRDINDGGIGRIDKPLKAAHLSITEGICPCGSSLYKQVRTCREFQQVSRDVPVSVRNLTPLPPSQLSSQQCPQIDVHRYLPR